MHFDWTLIRTFLAVADAGSYSAAARHLGISQPTVGRHVQDLEGQLDLKLFKRADKGYDLTDNGASLIDAARDMMSGADKIGLRAAGKSTRLDGTIRLSASEVVGAFFLPQLVCQLHKQAPSVQVELVLSNTNNNLFKREADIAVRMVAPEQPDLIARKLGQIKLGLFASKIWVEANENSIEVSQDPATFRLIGSDTSNWLIEGMEKSGFSATREIFPIRTDNLIAYHNLIVAGAGVGVAQVNLAKRDGLVQIMPELVLPDLPVWLVAHQELKTSARIRFVFDFLTRELPGALGL